MRKNTPRKWIHAILDMLPLLVIPIFAIFTRNENSTFEQSITVNQNEVVDFNQLINPSKRAEYVEYDNYTYIYSQSISDPLTTVQTWIRNGLTLINGHTYYCPRRSNTSDAYFSFYNYTEGYINVPNDTFYVSEYTNNFDCNVVFSSFTGTAELNISLIDITQMFGSGNEPTFSQFKQWYPNDYYAYTLSKKELIKDVSTVTYNDIDIGSQFMYALYKPIDKYFNFNKLFNMQDVYDWLQLNLFEGNAPIPVHIVWNIIVYEFFIDLIFLFYSVFMFFIDFATNMLDSFTHRNGGR